MGNLVTVTEPNPAGGANLVTSYTYNAVNQLTHVTMPRSTGTQTRSFAWSGVDLASATNPENGTVSYAYDGAHHMIQRTDALGQQTRYSYDTYGRLTQVQHWTGSPLAEQTLQRVTYYWDSNPVDSTYSQNTWGRTAAVSFGGIVGPETTYMYSYNTAGRVLKQRLHQSMDVIQDFDATYSWDQEGKMTSLGYPSGGSRSRLMAWATAPSLSAVFGVDS